MKGYSLHVGVGFVDERSYGIDLEIQCCTKDALNMFELMKNSDSYVETQEPLIECNATYCNFKEKINSIASKANNEEDGAYIVITFSGHGMTYPFKDTENNLEFLCFYDRMVLECELTELLKIFSEKVNLFIVIDSCYSNGIFSDSHHKGKSESVSTVHIDKSLLKSQIDQIFAHNENKEKYKELAENFKHTNPTLNNSCKLSACAKNQTTTGVNDRNANSDFTGVLLSEMESINNYKEHNDLFIKIKEHFTYPKGPRIIGEKNTFFASHKPFNINKKTPIMSWNIEFDETEDPLHCTVHHPNGMYIAGSIIETTNTDHPLLGANFKQDHTNYVDNETILILLLDKNHSSTATENTKSKFNLNRNLITTTDLPKTFVIVYDNTPGNKTIKGPGKRSSKKVSNELGGGIL